MSPTVYRGRGYRFFFFSREEPRMHVHVACASAEAKFWLESNIALANSSMVTAQQLREIESIIEVHKDEFISAWRKHFGG